MKTIPRIFLLMIAFIATQAAMAQENPASINDSAGAWRVNYINDNGSGGTYFTHDHYRYTFDGDTLIDDRYYHKLYRGGHSWAEDFFGGETYNHIFYADVFAGGVRVEGRKWFYFDASDLQQEFLLYDFELNPGDSLPVTFNNYITGMVVSVVDTVIVNDIPRRRMFIEGYNGPSATFIIEGIGGNTGLIEPMQMFEPIWYLVCYAEDGVPVWNESGADCNLTVNSSTQPFGKTVDLTIFPNPVTNEVTVRFPFLFESSSLSVQDIHGRMLQQINLSAGMTETGFNPDFAPGFYFLTLKSGNLFFLGKFIKQ